MPPATLSEKLKTLAKDLSKDVPRSPRDMIGGYVLAARMLDKCRAQLNGTNGEYHFNCPLDNMVIGFSGIVATEFEAYVATGASDEEVGEWLKAHAKQKELKEIVAWNNKMRDMSLSDLPIDLQLYMENYIPECVPQGKVVYRFFDVYDYEEGRL